MAGNVIQQLQELADAVEAADTKKADLDALVSARNDAVAEKQRELEALKSDHDAQVQSAYTAHADAMVAVTRLQEDVNRQLGLLPKVDPRVRMST